MSFDAEVSPVEANVVPLFVLAGAEVPLVEALNDGIVVADVDNRILYANQAVANLLGWDPAALVGQHVTVLVPERLRFAHASGFARYFETGKPHIVGKPTRVPALRRDGTEQSVELVLSMLKLAAGGELAVATLRDVADRVDLERQTALAHHLLSLFVDAAEEDDLAEHVVAVLGEELDAAFVALWLPVDDGDALECASLWRSPMVAGVTLEAATRGQRLNAGVGLPGRVWRQGEPLWIVDVTEDANFPRAAAARVDGLRSAFAVPIRNRSRTLGVVELFFPERRAPELALLDTMTVIGARLGEFLDRRHLEAENRLIAERERAVARVLQESLLPPTTPSMLDVDIGIGFHPGGELVVGGDFYDCFPIDETRGSETWGLLIGDVCGTGPAAAAVTGLVRHSVRALARTGMAPGDVLSHVNTSLLDPTASDGRFCTCLFGIVARDTGGRIRIRVANAGHPSPIVRPATTPAYDVPVSGPLLGVIPSVTLDDYLLVLGPGDTLIAYTDGVTEARRDSELFGDERLRDLIDAHRQKGAHDLARTILTQARSFASRPCDDMVVLTIRARSSEPRDHTDGTLGSGTLEP
ncbi:MAG: SpoIIE family protein phosphatase [Acidimicrobiia bacterium]